MYEEWLNTKVVKSRAEEYRRKLTMANLLKIKVATCRLKKLNLLAKLFALILTNKLIKLSCIGDIKVDACDSVATSMGITEGEKSFLISVITRSVSMIVRS